MTRMIEILICLILTGCAVKIKESRFNSELNRYEIKPSESFEPWIALRDGENRIVSDSAGYARAMRESETMKTHAEIETRFNIEKRLLRRNRNGGNNMYYDAVRLYRQGAFSEAAEKFNSAVYQDSLLGYKSDVYLWLSLCHESMQADDSAGYYYDLYQGLSESNIFPGFFHEMPENPEMITALKNPDARKDSVLSLGGYHTNIYQKPSFKRRPYYIGSSPKTSDKGVLMAGASYSRDENFAGLLGLELSPKGLFTPDMYLKYGSQITVVSLGTSVKHLESRYHEYASKFRFALAYVNNTYKNIEFDFWQPMAGYEINYFPLEKIGTFCASYGYLYNQWNKHETPFSRSVFYQWNENKLVLGISYFIHEDINITGRLNNFQPEALLDLGYVQLGIRKEGVFLDLFNFWIRTSK